MDARVCSPDRGISSERRNSEYHTSKTENKRKSPVQRYLKGLMETNRRKRATYQAGSNLPSVAVCISVHE